MKTKKLNKNNKLQTPHVHPSHKDTVTRLRRASGHLSKVVSMTESGDKCVDILQQLSAVISALQSCRVNLLNDHIKTCIVPIATDESQQIIRDLETVIQRALK